jgi:hypothetical protein
MRNKFNTEQKTSTLLLAIKNPVSSAKEGRVYIVGTTEALEMILGELLVSMYPS